MDNLAPIVLFVYNRPWHTEQTLNYLMLNELADQSVLYIYADGQKINATDEDIENIQKVRSFIRSKQWCKDVYIIEAEKNKGLANSIIDGVSEVISKHDKVIVLEDDLVTSVGFLKYMNEALELYKDEEKVAGVSGFSFIESPDETFFLRLTSCLGWGTWKHVWSNINFDTTFWLDKISNAQIKYDFNLKGLYNYYEMLQKQHEGKTNSWAIRFYAYSFFNQLLFLYPKRTVLFHIGYDSGTNCSGAERSDLSEYQFLETKIHLRKLEVKEEKYNWLILKKYLTRNQHVYIYFLTMKLKRIFNRLIRIR